MGWVVNFRAVHTARSSSVAAAQGGTDAYQAAKALDLLEREHVRSAPTPAVPRSGAGR